MRSRVVIAIAGSHPGLLIAIGTTALFLGAAIALVMSNELYDGAGWSKKMEHWARLAAYGGAFLLFMGVYGELGPGQVALKAVMLAPATLVLVSVLVTSEVLLRRRGQRLIPYVLRGLRARGEEEGVQEQPDEQHNGQIFALDHVEGDGHDAASPKRSADDGKRADAPAPQATEP